MRMHVRMHAHTHAHVRESQNWKYVDVAWLNKIKTDSEGNVHFEAPSRRMRRPN
jgi:hypothetical protein